MNSTFQTGNQVECIITILWFLVPNMWNCQFKNLYCEFNFSNWEYIIINLVIFQFQMWKFYFSKPISWILFSNWEYIVTILWFLVPNKNQTVKLNSHAGKTISQCCKLISKHSQCVVWRFTLGFHCLSWYQTTIPNVGKH